jgi:Transposase DDE domain
VAGFVADLRELKVTPHVAQNTTNRSSAIDGRTTRHAGYAISQRIRKRIEEGFGWVKTCGGLRKTRHKGTERVGWSFTLAAAACNLIRLPKLIEIKGWLRQNAKKRTQSTILAAAISEKATAKTKPSTKNHPRNPNMRQRNVFFRSLLGRGLSEAT